MKRAEWLPGNTGTTMATLCFMTTWQGKKCPDQTANGVYTKRLVLLTIDFKGH